ncbi:MAG TPA: transcription termination/antitermination protein NusG [Firmicutes bacterium]|nr:transcription termination/antitermination protein NusG [Bacillota bacterium]
MTNSRGEEKQWYVVHTYSGYENKVKTNLEKRLESMGMQDKIFRVLVPMEEQIEIKDGKKKITKKKVFPGYVLVEMLMSDDSWYVVRNTPGVTGFVGPGSKPIPLREHEAQAILQQMGIEDAKPRLELARGQNVRLVDGPFEGFMGTVDEVLADRGKVRVHISLFGRDTPLEVDFVQIEKM